MLRLILAAAALVALDTCAFSQSTKHKFFWIVLNNNRLVSDDAEQDRYEKQLCRALDCSGSEAAGPGMWFCLQMFGSSKYDTRGVGAGSRSKEREYCAREGYRVTRDDRYWTPFPDGVRTRWQQGSGQYERGLISSKVREIRAWRPETSKGEGEVCHWQLEGVDPRPISKPCDSDEPANLYHAKVELGRKYKLTLRIGDDPLTIEREVQVDDVVFAIVGDSYASGEGNPHTFRDMAAKRVGRKIETWLDRRCHRSLIGFPTMAISIAAMLDRQQGGDLKHTFTPLTFACSGAEIRGGGGLLAPYAGIETRAHVETFSTLFPDVGAVDRRPLLKPQLEQLKEALCPAGTFPCGRAPDFLLISIGGNDIGFGSIIRELITYCGKPSGRCAIDRVMTRLRALEKSFDDLAAEIAKLKVTRKVFLTEYPNLTQNETGRPCDDINMEKTLGPASLGEMDYWIDVPSPWARIGVSARESEKAYRTVLRPLNEFLLKVAKKHGWTIVAGAEHQSAFKGWCARPSWFVRWIDSKHKQGMLPDAERPSRLSDRETTGVAHPNIYGHNWLNWQIRCHLEKERILPPGSTQQGGRGRAENCGERR